MDEAEHGLHDLLLERLLSDPDLTEQVLSLVLAAWAGDDDLAAALDGRPTPAADPAVVPARPAHPEVYLAAVHVEGFRGIGERAMLPLRPGPGLTLVTGRNGSGKSSFAEAAELALTGASVRWSGRTAVWKDGWRNLHEGLRAGVAVDLITAGASATTTIARRWEPDQDLLDGRWTRQRRGEPLEDFDGAEWQDSMRTYRPFLSYSELGSLIDGKPSELHDALKNLLGLAPLAATQTRLTTARKSLAEAARLVTTERKALRVALDAVDDERAARAAALLKPTSPDLDAVGALVLGGAEDATEIAALRALTTLTLPDPVEVASALTEVRAGADRVSALASDEARAADETADLLRAALHRHDTTGDGPCPVCDQGRLDGAWHTAAAERLTILESTAADLRRATGDLGSAAARLRGLASDPPLAPLTSIDATAAREAWSTWADAARVPGPSELAREMETAWPTLVSAISDLRERAAVELTRRDEVWGPLARRIGSWHDDACAVRAESGRVADLQRAETWLAETSNALRDQRLAPFAEASQRVWQQLRQQSNVELGPVRLDGANTRRRATMTVSVDGADGGTALGVMSQGELHALGLSLFLPRATVEQSPFRFVLIDDPVQAMDPAKVDGLARVLAEVAVDRQVVVFTHDDRLADAVRRLEVPATVWEVQRRERSVVELCRSDDPVTRYLSDARAIALTDRMPADLRSELVASCCRSAIEAACHAKVRAVRLGRGETYAAVEAALSEASTTNKKATLAVLDDPDRGGDLLTRLRAAGPGAVDAFQACKRGAHRGLTGNLRSFLNDVQNLADWIQK